MAHANDQRLGSLAKLVIAIAVVLIAVGVLQHGVALETIQRALWQLTARPGGAMTFRFILQPAMAAIAAIHDGRGDARLARPPYLRTMLREPQHRIPRLREGLNTTARIILLGMIVDAIYQIIEFEGFYPSEVVIVALMLAFIPYVVIRGVALRLARRRSGNESPHQVQRGQ